VVGLTTERCVDGLGEVLQLPVQQFELVDLRERGLLAARGGARGGLDEIDAEPIDEHLGWLASAVVVTGEELVTRASAT
jgi:hypothetical protein